MSHSPWASTAALVRDRAKTLGAAEALVDGELRLSFAALAGRVQQAARAFMSSGVQKGERISIWAPNIHEWVITALGLQAAGAVLVPLNTRFKGAEAADILKRSGAKLLFTVRGFLGADYPAMLAPHRKELPALREIVILRGETGADTAWADFLARAEATSDAAQREREAQVGPNDLSDIMYTSGTTGRAKGAMLEHGQMLRAYQSAAGIVDIRQGDRYLIIPPFFHSFGYKFGFVTTLIAGATAVPLAVFDVVEMLRLIEKERISFVPGPPTLFYSLLDHPERKRFDISSLRNTLTGAATTPPELIRRMRTELPFKTIVTGYGLTETTAVASMSRHDDADADIVSTSGRAFPDVEVKVAETDGAAFGAERPRGERGEVWVRGFNVMRGYLDDPEQTAAAITPDGWLRTGDIGIMDERGYLRIVDRLKDMYIVGGFNAYPAEIEALLLENPKIAQAAVVGAPDARLGEVGAAFVQLRPGERATSEELIAWCREHMANFKVPRYVEVVEAFPLNASGKVLRYELRERAKTLVAQQ